jgi:hypothetical protein
MLAVADGVNLSVNRVNRVNLGFSDLSLPDPRGPNYPQSIYATRGTLVLTGQSALLSTTEGSADPSAGGQTGSARSRNQLLLV